MPSAVAKISNLSRAKLEPGQSLTSRNGAYALTLQGDGNLVLAAGGQAVWATGTNGQNVVRAEVQTDGNFVLYTPDKPVWDTDTKGAKDVRLLLQDDRNPVLYGFDGPAWASDTQISTAATDAPPPPPAADETAPDVVPAAAEEPAPAPEPELARTYTVVSGDTCGRSRNGFTVTAANTRRSPTPAASPTLT
jgi:hypothetical protein